MLWFGPRRIQFLNNRCLDPPMPLVPGRGIPQLMPQVRGRDIANLQSHWLLCRQASGVEPTVEVA